MKKLSHLLPAWTIIPLVYGAICLFTLRPEGKGAYALFITFFLIVTLASLGLFSDERPYSLNRMFWLFVLMAFGLVPTYQAAVRHFPWDTEIAFPTLLKTNMLVLLGIAGYQLARWICDSLYEEQIVLIRGRVGRNLVRNYIIIGTLVLLFIFTGYTALIGIRHIWLKGQIDIRWGERLSSATYLVVEKLIRGPVLYLMLLTALLYRLRRISKAWMTGILLLCFWINFPLALPRYLQATVCLAVLLSFGGHFWQRQRQAFSWLILAAWVLVYPLMGVSRWGAERGRKMLQESDKVFRQSFVSGDFDSYATLARTIDYTALHGRSGGRQLLTASLFFVPRNYWPEKSVGSGALVYGDLGFSFTNMASPLFAEGYIDFGWPGTFLYAFVIGLFAARYDRHYWRWRLHRAAEGDFSFLTLFYPAFLFLFFFLLRGDLLSSLSAIAGLSGTAWLLHLLLKLRLHKE